LSKYSLILSKLVSPNTKIKVLELCKNDESIFQSFISEIEKDTNLFNQLSGAVSIIENSANLLTMPKVGYFGVMVPPVSVKQCHFERYCNYIKN